MDNESTRKEWTAQAVNAFDKYPRIKPCAQCGNDPVVALTNSGHDWARWFIECPQCKWSVDEPFWPSQYHSGGIETVIDDWNFLNRKGR